MAHERLYQLRFSSKTQHALFPTEVERRRAVRRLARVLQGRLAFHGFVDQHGHNVTFAPEDGLGKLCSAIHNSLGAITDEPLEVWHEPVKDRSHLKALLRYQLNQPPHHGIPVHPALWTGSSFLDIIGARAIEGLELRLFEALPRLVPADLLPMVGLKSGSIRPASDRLVRSLGASRLVQAAAAALAAPPDLQGKSQPVVAARRAAANLGRTAGIADGEVRWALECSRWTLTRLNSDHVDPATITAVRRRLSLEEVVRREVEQGWCRRTIQERAKSR